MKFFWGILVIIIGIGVIRYSFQLVNIFGRVAWAEEHLRGGFAGTYTLYKLAGLILIILALLYMFGGIGFIIKPLAPLFGGVK